MPVLVNEILGLASNPNPKSIDPRKPSFLYNMEYDGKGAKIRKGLSLWKSNSQWGDIRCRGGTTYKKSSDAFYYYFLAFANGEVYYVKNTDFEANTAISWTRLANTSGGYPALSSSNTYITMEEFNDKLYFSDESETHYYFNDTTGQLVAITSPPEKPSGSRIGDLDVYRDLLLVCDDEGYGYLSNTNDGTTYLSGNFVRFGRLGGLKVTNVFPFNRGAAICLSEPLTEKYKTQYMTGRLLYDPTIEGTEVDSIRVEPLSDSIALVGRSGKQIGTNLLGLTQLGFTKLQELDKVGSQSSLVSEDTSNIISEDIDNWIKKINYSKPETIYSTIDKKNGRYLCAVPGQKSNYANLIFVYDFRKSTPEDPKWMIWKYAISGISALFSFKGKPFVADLKGNIYETDIEGQFNDNGNAYTAEWRSAGLFAESANEEKKFDDAGLFLKVPAEEFEEEIQSYAILDNVPITQTNHGTETILKTIKTKLVEIAEFISTKIFTTTRKWGSGYSGEFHLKLTENLGHGRVVQLVARTTQKDVEWGINGFYVNDTMRNESRGDYKGN